ncbi:Ig heavy chain Mem5-like [Gymnogyps californianus]|uniref:Ig heavy chain Mem5-like n=1 Tax=Gymnogyps californianus TaxID=33616 RepID=UPI0021C6E540|nr:Ig heavy chain Mem5-like [Gymnogyps californianus]
MAPGLGPWLLALSLAAGPAGVWAQLRLVEAGGGLRAPGDSVLLSCRGSGFTFGSYAILWYRQAPGGSLEWVSVISYDSSVIRFGQSVEGRATASRDNSRSEASLSLRALHPRDSARYFCALRYWSVSVRTDKLVFGSGTTLTVEPKSQNNSVPQVIVMKSKKLEEDGSIGKAACLARNVYTKNIRLEMSSNEVVYEQNTSILTSEGLYDTIKVVNVTKDTEVTCVAKFNGRTITANTTLPEKEAEEPVTGKVCNTTDTSAQDIKVEKANMLSMAVLGLRVLLAKSIAFNTLMSIKLFLF